MEIPLWDKEKLPLICHASRRGAFHSFEKAYEIFSEQKDFYGFLMDFSCKQRNFGQRRTRFFGVKCPSPQDLRCFNHAALPCMKELARGRGGGGGNP